MGTPVDPTQFDLLRLFNGILSSIIEDPSKEENMIVALRTYCEGTVKPSETLIVIASLAIAQYAKLLTEVNPDRMDLVAWLNEQTIAGDVNELFDVIEQDGAS
ncbi:MAG TPA: hypothetical protein VGM94_12865 [Galbitalea sp.]